ncbi:MAG: transglutaminase-like cysteine peptidase [Alphaproteobacteria bacterium]|nr:transglutaminase-like cysteine peptidase [Alphaproteobacteria bacterium]MBU1552122.1 transglutaminase-like cysteine peptidase [Alphaproteobacteria bacterium]MBU2336353.1 transglutaminase-like cysteine peptidase [Alphaproteobacteria bacterium]MBU2388198.1 transglutaminase-like cysteine peptidase [Alphaproteobacteria bacterium]|tara:strand:- start:1129 stop:1740 length:612 start_codon:yes stop_codon:yes gene_type:complete
MRFCSIAFSALAAAALAGSANIAASETSGGKSMIIGGTTSQPIGHYEFCRRNVVECSIRLSSSPAPKLSAQGWAAIEEVNRSVNKRIAPKTDKQIFGQEEVWAYPTTEGDCEDYALLKRRELTARGFSLSDLLMTVVRKPDGEGHAVLTVRTAHGDFVLDNLDSEVRAWSETPYVYVKRQSSSNTGRWVGIESGKDVPVGSVR